MKFNSTTSMCWMSLIVSALIVTGCTSTTYDWPTSEQKNSVWLSEAPRQIVVKVDPELPSPDLVSRDRKVGERVGKGVGLGALGAGQIFLEGCKSGGPLGCVVGAFLSPVGFIAGAVTGAVLVDTEETHRPLADQKGAGLLFGPAGAAPEIASIIAEHIVSQARQSTRHEIRSIAQAKIQDGHLDSAAELNVFLSSVSLLGDTAEDPSLAIRIRGSSRVSAPAEGGAASYEFEYEGSSRRLSEWLGDGARLLRMEIARAGDQIAADIVDNLLVVSPDEDTVSKVMAARAQRAKKEAAIERDATSKDEKSPGVVRRVEVSENKSLGSFEAEDEDRVTRIGILKGKKITNYIREKQFKSVDQYPLAESSRTSDCWIIVTFKADGEIDGGCHTSYQTVESLYRSGRWNVTDNGSLCLMGAFFGAEKKCYRFTRNFDEFTLTGIKDPLDKYEFRPY